MDAISYHRSRADQHRRMLAICDGRHASIHQQMVDLHEDRAAYHDKIATADVAGLKSDPDA